MIVRLKTDVEIPAHVAPTEEAIPAGAMFAAPQPWWQDRSHSPVLETVPVNEFSEAMARGEVFNRDPEDAPKRYREAVAAEQPDEGPSPEPDTSDEEPGGATEAEKIQQARTIVGEQEDEIAETLPDEQPDEDAPAARRILWALLNGSYQARQSILAATSERSAKGTADELEDRLYGELYDREMAEG